MGNKLKTKERKYFFTQHAHSLRNLLQRGAVMDAVFGLERRLETLMIHF